MTKPIYCPPSIKHPNHHDYCRSPVACGGWGYCRERNFDGLPMDEANINRRKIEGTKDFETKGR